MRMKKVYALAVVFLLTGALLPPRGFGMDAAQTDTHYVFTLYPSDDAYIRSAKPGDVQTGSSLALDSAPADHRIGYLKFDLSQYQTAVKYADEINLTVTTVNSTAGKTMACYALPEELNGWKRSTLTYNAAKSLVMPDDVTNLVNYEQNVIGEFDNLADKTPYTTGNIKQQVQNKMELGVKIASTGSNGGFLVYGKDNGGRSPALVIKVRKDLNQPEFDLYYDLLQFDMGDLSCLETDIELPAEYQDIKIDWSSSDQRVITDTGTVVRQRPDYGQESEVKQAVLTAVFSRNGTQLVRRYDVGVKTLKTSIVASEDAYVWGAGSKLNSNFGSHSGMVLDCDAANHRYGLVRFDFTELSKQLGPLARAELRLTTSGDGAAKGFRVHPIAGETKKKWSEAVDTYNTLAQAGLKDYLSDSPITVSNTQANTVYTIDVTEYIARQTDGIAEFKLESLTGAFTIFSRETAGKEPKLTLYPSYQSDFELTVNDQTDLEQLPHGALSVKASIDNRSGAYNGGLLLVTALYDVSGLNQKRLTDVAVLQAGSVPVQERAEVMVEIDVPERADQELVILVLDDVISMKPYIGKLSFRR